MSIFQQHRFWKLNDPSFFIFYCSRRHFFSDGGLPFRQVGSQDHSAECLKPLLAFRCNTYAWQHWGTKQECTRATAALIEEMDIHQVNPGDQDPEPLKLHQEILSRKTFAEFYQDANLAHRLNRYTDELSDSYRFNHSHSLWNSVLKDSGTFERALAFMAMVFQDITDNLSFARDQMHRLQLYQYSDLMPPSPGKTRYLANLGAFDDFFKPLSSEKIQNIYAPTYDLYPELPFQNELTPYFHHFYVPAYLTSRLIQRGFSERMASFAVLLMNTSYEFRKIDVKLGQKRWPFLDPKPFWGRQDREKTEINIQKIYTGYLAVLWGIHREKMAVSYSVFSGRLTRDPYHFMQAALLEYPPVACSLSSFFAHHFLVSNSTEGHSWMVSMR